MLLIYGDLPTQRLSVEHDENKHQNTETGVLEQSENSAQTFRKEVCEPEDGESQDAEKELTGETGAAQSVAREGS